MEEEYGKEKADIIKEKISRNGKISHFNFETKKKMSDSAKNRKYKDYDAFVAKCKSNYLKNYCLKETIGHPHQKGYKHTEESKVKMRNRVYTEEQKKNASENYYKKK